jgi:hypothetical protein
MNKSFLIVFFTGLLLLTAQSSFGQEKVEEQKTDAQLINELIAKKKEFNKEFKYGYRIQLYNGFEVEAKKTQAKFKIEFPEIRTYIVYRQPEWKIQVGTYKTKLEADRALLEIKREFSGAIVVPLGK